MAALKDANAMPNDVDDLTDTTPQLGSADSGSTVYGTFTFVPFTNFPIVADGVDLEIGDDGDVWGVVAE